MQSTISATASKKNIDLSSKSATEESSSNDKVTVSDDDTSTSSSASNSAYQQGSAQEFDYPENKHNEKPEVREKPYEKNYANITHTKEIKNKNHLESTTSHESSADDSADETKSYTVRNTGTEENKLLASKRDLEKQIRESSGRLEKLNPGGREYENQERALDKLKRQLSAIKIQLQEVGFDSGSPEQEEKSASEHEFGEKHFHSFNEITAIEKIIEDIEEQIKDSNTDDDHIQELTHQKSYLMELRKQFLDIEKQKNSEKTEKDDNPSGDKKSKIKRTHAVPRDEDRKRKEARATFYAENANADYAYPAEDPEYFFLKYTYADLYSKLKNCLDNIIQLQKDLKNEKSKNKKNELQKQYKILENISRQLHELSIKQTDSILADSDEKFLEELLEKLKSDDTRNLENDYDEAVSGYKKELDSYSLTWLKSASGKLLVGPLAFLVSFGVANTVNRLAPPRHQRWIGYSISPFWAAASHALLAGPIAKQGLSHMWTSPILGEMKNYFQLLASYTTDRIRGQVGEKKYRSKNPEKTEKLTIAERWAEERSIWLINPERIKIEESGFFAYSISYIIKGIAPACWPAAYASEHIETRGVDAAAHFVAGSVASVGNVYAQQHLRSQHPQAKELMLPTRALWALEAAKLRSLATDLARAIDSGQYRNDYKTSFALKRLLRQTNKAAVIAERKSSLLGTLRQDILDSLKDTASQLDMTAEILGRFLSLMFVAGMSQVTAELRKSTHPGLRFLGHVIPAIDLIAPPGWALRGLYTGYIRAALQVVRDLMTIPEEKPDVATVVPAAVLSTKNDQSHPGSQSETATYPIDDDADHESTIDESILIDSTDSSDESDWDGNPKSRDERGL